MGREAGGGARRGGRGKRRRLHGENGTRAYAERRDQAEERVKERVKAGGRRGKRVYRSHIYASACVACVDAALARARAYT